MRYFVVISIILLVLMLTIAPADTGVRAITLNKSELGWSVTYQLNEPVHRLMLLRSPDHSRSERWRALDSQFEIAWQDNSEVIVRRDGEAFDEASFVLASSFITLPQDYAPFAPYSDGGMLVHTGRFFACADTCTDAHHEWPMAINLSTTDYLLLDGFQYTGYQEWLDADNGRVIYIGQTPLEYFTEVHAIIDPALPNSLYNRLRSEIPMMMNYFGTHLEPLLDTPMLFASYSGAHDSKYFGHQGGVLPNQIFMHWYGTGALENMNEQNTLWFFAHEIAHLYQGAGLSFSTNDEAWIHEGVAELMAYLYTDDKLMPEESWLQQALKESRRTCRQQWPVNQSIAVAAALNTQANYSCGLVANAQLHQQLIASGYPQGIYALWTEYVRRINQGKSASAATYFDAFHALTGLPIPSLRGLVDSQT